MDRTDMETIDLKPIKGDYTANLLGNIRSHLAGLQGYDVMALELIQNADDAKAEEIIFDITDKGLWVLNSGHFTYCEDLNKRPCKFVDGNNNYSCDYHRIVDVGSGGKLSKRENIGRFGIGFVSTYQVTDHPEIRSSGIKLILYPEKGEWSIEAYEEPFGTSFFLPWADDPKTQARQSLGVSHITKSNIDQLTDDFQKVLRESLLFLRHVRKAEVRRNGEMLLSCDLERNEQSELLVSFSPSDDVELWHIIRADASESAERLYLKYPYLKTLDRTTEITIGLRIEPEPLKEGFLYAFLPTEQSTGLPLHINADFFPEADRKSVIFAGHQHEQAWNGMIITEAANELAKDPEALIKILGPKKFWEIYRKAYGLYSETSDHPSCFERFWEKLKATGTESRIVKSEDGHIQLPNDVFVPRRAPLDANEAEIFLKIGGRVISTELWPFQVVINQLGSPYLTLDRLVKLLNSAMEEKIPGESQIEEDQLNKFYTPLWSLINDLMPEKITNSNQTVKQLRDIPFLITDDLYIVTANQPHIVPKSIDTTKVVELLPTMAMIPQSLLKEFSKIIDLIKPLTLGSIVDHIDSYLRSVTNEEVNDFAPEDLRDLYSLFVDIDRQSDVEDEVYKKLQNLPIWKTSQGLVKANEAFLPGNFKDPTGYADLFDLSVLNDQVKEFLINKLDVQKQTIEAFVKTVLPSFFDEDGPRDEEKYSLLIVELANHSSILNDEEIILLLEDLPIIPTQDGNWSFPSVTYHRSENLVKVLGDALHLWLDTNRIPNKRSVNIFIDTLGIQKSPLPLHLADRIITVAENSLPTETAKQSSSEAFYTLCDNYDEWKDKNDFQDALEELKRATCFPAQGDNEKWFEADSLYAPYRAEAFQSQVQILDFQHTRRIKSEFLRDLGISTNPETELIIEHLRQCVSAGIQPHIFTYQILNERAQKDEDLISTLIGEKFIYVESQKTFVRPNQLYWWPPKLGRYAFTIPSIFESFKPLFETLGVKNAPEGKDFVDILLDIVGVYFEQSIPVTGQDRAVYDICFSNVSLSYENEELYSDDLLRLKEAPTILNLKSQPTHPDEVLLQDSEWHVGFFDGELEQALCSYPPEQIEFIEQMGVRRLTEAAKVSLAFIDGEEITESDIATSIIQRITILKRLLHDKIHSIRKKVEDGLSGLSADSFEKLHIQASVFIGGEEVLAPEVSTSAYYDIDKKQLVLARPIGKSCWTHIFNAILHQLMPEETGSEISKLTLILRPLMDSSIEEGHQELTDAGIPELEKEIVDIDMEELESPDLDEIGSESVTIENERAEIELNSNEIEHDRQLDEANSSKENKNEDINYVKKDRFKGPRDEALQENESNDNVINQPNSMFNPKQGSSTNKKSAIPRPRPKHKEKWDRRLLSYVRKLSDDVKDNENAFNREHNLRIEAFSRDAVCAYEKKCGRVPTQMAQTHPGYDITSINPLTDEKRYIEVKGINGEWNVTGVGLSKLQFSNAQDFGDEYWLYVVEFASDYENKRIHPIQNPANKVTSFMFDGNWRDAVSEEGEDPALAFIPGAKVEHTSFGLGIIKSVEKKGVSRMMFIDFDDYGRKPVTLNLQIMSVIEEHFDYDYTEFN